MSHPRPTAPLPRLCRSPNPPRRRPDPPRCRPSTPYTAMSATGPGHHPFMSSGTVLPVDLKFILVLLLGPFPGPRSLAFDLIPPWISRLGLLLFRQAREKEEKKLKANQKEAARLQAQAASDGPKKSDKKQRKNVAKAENPEDIIDPDTPNGEKKSPAIRMAKQYSQSMVCLMEVFRIFCGRSCYTKPPFVMVLPPLNVTGALNIGHALMVVIEVFTVNAFTDKDSCRLSTDSHLQVVGCVKCLSCAVEVCTGYLFIRDK